MKISTKGRYALRLMLDLAMADGDKPCNLKKIAENQEISEKYLEQIISMLNKAGYVRSVRGAQGGYFLAMKPEEYSVGMILRATEELELVDCVDDPAVCARKDICASVYVWQKLQDAINETLDAISLTELMELQKKKELDCPKNSK